MHTRRSHRTLGVMVVVALALCLSSAGAALAQMTGIDEELAQNIWVGQIGNVLDGAKKAYPSANFEPYKEKLILLEKAVGVGDERTTKTELQKFFTMLRERAHGIPEAAADEIFNFALMVSPVQEYQVAVPPSPTWIDQLNNAVLFHRATSPGGNWEPYLQKLTVIRDAVRRGEMRRASGQMGVFFGMLRTHAHGIDDVAADDIYNFALMLNQYNEPGIASP